MENHGNVLKNTMCDPFVCVLWQRQGQAVVSMFETETSTIHFCAKDGITWTAASSPQRP